ncbi:MAG: hypothetical protein PHV05_04790 [Candidatus Riflebacteria bacterium]|nr:hypothetical protein [Candidatus Riflebacteria bacterium]
MRIVFKSFFAVFCCLIAIPSAAVEIKYGFKTGNTYEYQYSQTISSKATAFTVNSSRNSPASTRKFSVKAIDFQNNAFVLDIGDKDATFRRYIHENGEIKGAPAETGQNIPFFLTFPDGDWKVSERQLIKKDFVIGSKKVTAEWNLLLKSIDKDKGTAEILFAASMKLPGDNLRQKDFTLKGRAIFNLLEGVVHQAEWTTLYKFNFSNKEIAVIRDLWSFEKQVSHSLILSGIQE